MAVKQIGQATSSAVAVGGWQLAWRRCGGVDGAGWGAVVGEVVCMLSAGVVRSMASSGGTGHHAHRAQSPKDQRPGESNAAARNPLAGFNFVVGCPCPLFGFPPLVTRLLFLFF